MKKNILMASIALALTASAANAIKIVNKNSLDVRYAIYAGNGVTCLNPISLSKGTLGIGGSVTFTKSSFREKQDYVCVRAKGNTSITGSGGFTSLLNNDKCEVTIVDGRLGVGVSTETTAECHEVEGR